VNGQQAVVALQAYLLAVYAAQAKKLPPVLLGADIEVVDGQALASSVKELLRRF
jgi:hypothetical protein